MTYSKRMSLIAGLAGLIVLGLGAYGWADRGVAVWIDMATAFVISCF